MKLNLAQPLEIPRHDWFTWLGGSDIGTAHMGVDQGYRFPWMYDQNDVHFALSDQLSGMAWARLNGKVQS